MPDTNTRRDALKKLGLFGLAFAAPTAAIAGSGGRHGHSGGGKVVGGSNDYYKGIKLWQRRHESKHDYYRRVKAHYKSAYESNNLPHVDLNGGDHMHDPVTGNHQNHMHRYVKVRHKRWRPRRPGCGQYSRAPSCNK